MASSADLFDDASQTTRQRLLTKTRVRSDSVGQCKGLAEGKACALRPRKDTDENLVDGGPMKWGLVDCGKAMGKVCYYYRRVWRATYSSAFTLGKLIALRPKQADLRRVQFVAILCHKQDGGGGRA